MKPSRRPPMVIVGAASRDLDAGDQRGWRLGGGVTYGALAIARLGVPVRALLGADAQAAAAPELDVLRRAGVELRLVPLRHGPVFDNRPTRDGRRAQFCQQPSDRLPSSALPDDWRNTAAAVLAPVAGELGAGWARAFAHDTLVALGWQGLLRRLVAGQPVAALPLRPLELIARADVALVSVEDAVAGGAPIRRLIRRPGQQLVVTHGARPALHLARAEDGRLTAKLLPIRAAQSPRDPTGAGDVFLATWAAGVAALARRDGDRVLAVAAAAAAAKVESVVLDEMADLRELCGRLLRLPDASPARR